MMSVGDFLLKCIYNLPAWGFFIFIASFSYIVAFGFLHILRLALICLLYLLEALHDN